MTKAEKRFDSGEPGILVGLGQDAVFIPREPMKTYDGRLGWEFHAWLKRYGHLRKESD